jgi:hypothetical protein
VGGVPRRRTRRGRGAAGRRAGAEAEARGDTGSAGRVTGSPSFREAGCRRAPGRPRPKATRTARLVGSSERRLADGGVRVPAWANSSSRPSLDSSRCSRSGLLPPSCTDSPAAANARRPSRGTARRADARDTPPASERPDLPTKGAGPRRLRPGLPQPARASLMAAPPHRAPGTGDILARRDPAPFTLSISPPGGPAPRRATSQRPAASGLPERRRSAGLYSPR